MHIIHGTWIPDDAHEFIQKGAFYLWVETDTSPGTSRRRTGTVHPRHLGQSAPGPAGVCVWRVGAHPEYKILSAPDGRG